MAGSIKTLVIGKEIKMGVAVKRAMELLDQSTVDTGRYAQGLVVGVVVEKMDSGMFFQEAIASLVQDFPSIIEFSRLPTEWADTIHTAHVHNCPCQRKERREFFNNYRTAQARTKETLVKIQVYLDTHFATVSNELWLDRPSYGRVEDIIEVNRILKDALVCLTGEEIE